MPLPTHTGEPTTARHPMTSARPPRRVCEAETAHAIAAWLDGEPWSLSDAQWVPYGCPAVRLQEDGDTLALKGVPILTRAPRGLVPLQEGTRSCAVLDARAVCAGALKGYHVTLYPKFRRERGIVPKGVPN